MQTDVPRAGYSLYTSLGWLIISTIVLCDVPRLASALRAIFPSLTGRMQLTNDRGRLVGSRLSKLSVSGDVERAGPVCNLLQALDGLKSHSL